MSDTIIDCIWGKNAVKDLNKILGELDSYIEHYSEKNLIPTDVRRLTEEGTEKLLDALKILYAYQMERY